MTSSLLDSTHGHRKSGVTCHHCLWTAHTVGLGRQHRAWHDITAFGQHTHSGTTSGVAFHHRLWAAHMVKQLWAWHDITSFGQHTRSNVGRSMPSPPLDSTHSQTMSGVACHHRPWTAHSVERHRAWHDITALGQHTRSNDVRRGITSQPLDYSHGQTMSGVA